MSKIHNSHPKRKIKLVGDKKEALDFARGRLVFMNAVFVLAFILIAARLLDLGFIQGHLNQERQLSDISISSVDAVDHIVEARGNIYDRNGVLLATSLQVPSLYVDPALVLNAPDLASSLVRIIPELSYGDVLRKMQRKGRFVWLHRNLTPDQQHEILGIGDPALGFKNEWRRVYPQGRLMSHIVGYSGVDGDGLAGVERSFDNIMGEKAHDVYLTLDTRLQHILRREIEDASETFDAIGGAGVVMDIKTGEVLAAVSLPDFDPQNINDATNDQKFNRLSLGVYELGSVFKVFSTAAYLEFVNDSLATTFDTSEPLRRGGFPIRDFHPEERPLTIPEVFMHSSNIGAALMGEAVGTDDLKSFYKDLGLFDQLSLEIPEVGKPQYGDPWYEIYTLTASYGHGISVSPLQMVSAVASVIGDGTIVSPTLILNDQMIAAANLDGYKRADPKIRVVSPKTSHRIRQMMRLTVSDGTATKADVPGYFVGGKTGTADKADRGGYDRTKRISSFVAAFPMDQPRYAVFIMIDEPKGTKETFGYATGGWVAAPAVGRVITNMASVLKLEPRNVKPNEDVSYSLRQYIKNTDDNAQAEGVSNASF